MIDTIQLPLWTGVHLYEDTVVLSDQSHCEFIRRAHDVFRPYALVGTVRDSRPEIHRVVKELIASGDFISLEPSLYTRQFQGRNWNEVSVADGAFALQCSPWATSEEWVSFMPWMIEFLLRADHCVDSVESFLFSLRPGEVPRGNSWIDLLSSEACAVIADFLDRLYTKYTHEMGSLDSYGNGYHFLVNLSELGDSWARRVSPN